MNKSIVACYFDGWKKCFTYKGHATRKEFWSFVFVNLVIILAVAVGSLLWLMSAGAAMGMVWVFFVLFPLYAISFFLIIPLLSLGCRRMHDIGKSGWWFGGFVLLNMAVTPVVTTLVTHVMDKWLSTEASSAIFTIIYVTFTAISFIVPVWLCCKPTKIKEPTSSSDVVN